MLLLLCFYFLAMINKAAKNIHFGVDIGFHFSYMYTLVELPGHKLTYIKCCMIYINIYKGYIKKMYLRSIKYINSMFNIFRNCYFSKWLHYFTFPSAVTRFPVSLHSCQHSLLPVFFNSPSEFNVVSHCSFESSLFLQEEIEVLNLILCFPASHGQNRIYRAVLSWRKV